MNKVNKIILHLASLQAAILVNANAHDDDLEDTFNQARDDYEALKIILDKYFKLDDASYVECKKCGCTELLCGHNKRS